MAERLWFGHRRLGHVLEREGISHHPKTLLRVNLEETLRVGGQGGCKRALGTRATIVLPDGPNQRCSVDFGSDTSTCNQCFCILCVVDGYTPEWLVMVGDTSPSGLRVALELTQLIAMRGKPHTVFSDTARN